MRTTHPHHEHYEARKKALKEKGIKLVDIASELGIRPSNVTRNIQALHRARNRRIERYIARKLKQPLHKVYPEWYAPGVRSSRIRP